MNDYLLTFAGDRFPTILIRMITLAMNSPVLRINPESAGPILAWLLKKLGYVEVW